MNPPKYYVNLMRPYAEWDKDYFPRMEEMFAKAQSEAISTAVQAHIEHISKQIGVWANTDVPVEAVLAQILKTFKSDGWRLVVETHEVRHG